MPVESIRIRVGAEAAHAYRAVPEPDRREIDLRPRLREATQRPEVLEDVMREISQKAQERGLTEDALRNLLRDG